MKLTADQRRLLENLAESGDVYAGIRPGYGPGVAWGLAGRHLVELIVGRYVGKGEGHRDGGWRITDAGRTALRPPRIAADAPRHAQPTLFKKEATP